MGMRDGDFRFTPHPPFQPGTFGGITYEEFGFKGKFLPKAGDALRAASDVFRQHRAGCICRRNEGAGDRAGLPYCAEQSAGQ